MTRWPEGFVRDLSHASLLIASNIISRVPRRTIAAHTVLGTHLRCCCSLKGSLYFRVLSRLFALSRLRAVPGGRKLARLGAISGRTGQLGGASVSAPAPAFGYRDAFDYYAHASSNRLLHNIHVPALVVHAQDDPFIPFKVFHHPAFHQNPNLQLLAPRFGGHVAFLSRRKPRFWAEEQALRFCEGIKL